MLNANDVRSGIFIADEVDNLMRNGADEYSLLVSHNDQLYYELDRAMLTKIGKSSIHFESDLGVDFIAVYNCNTHIIRLVGWVAELDTEFEIPMDNEARYEMLWKILGYMSETYVSQ